MDLNKNNVSINFDEECKKNNLTKEEIIKVIYCKCIRDYIMCKNCEINKICDSESKVL